MRQGIAILAWTGAALYISSGCLDYLRVWTNAPTAPARVQREGAAGPNRPARYKHEVLPHLTACGERALGKLAGATGAIVLLYFASGWALDRVPRDAD
jgi:hypothetical protein